MTDKTPNHSLSPQRCPVTLADIDLFAEGAQEHWYEAYPILHAEAPVLRLPGEGMYPDTDGYVLTRYEDINTVVKDPVRFPPTLSLGIQALLDSGVPPEEAPLTNAMLASMATLRPTNELYRTHRQELTDPWVGPGASRHTEMIARHANALIDDWIDRGEMDFIHEFARPLPQRVMASVLGFPQEDIPRLAEWGTAQVEAFVHGRTHRNLLTDDQIRAQFEKLDGFKEYVYAWVKEKRANPKDDMISWLCQVEYQALGRKLTDLEVNGVVYAMLIGGLETTQYALEEQAQLLCENPQYFQQLKANRDLVRPFTEECMRLRSPTQGLSTRICSQDEVFQGVPVPKGSLLHLRFGAGNVDPKEWECPYEMRLDRKAVTRHVAFSAGPRVCPGAGISRVEQTVAWNCLLDRLDALEYGEGNTFEHQPGIMLGTLSLKLRFRRAAG
ncbi:MAG: cytochrome P450 [Pseudomonadales bacterium]|nr:cytochrome P450 [Pseudomonadales bacterium]MCP5183619.1 cytochrome P450 [Pseudomonadales bacterium]